MDDAFLVGSVECLGDLACNRHRVGNRQWTAREAISKGRSLDELEDQRCHTIGFFQSIDCADVGMIERREQPRFTREALRPLSVVGEVRR